MKLSIIVSVLNSHEIVRRQLLHFEKMDMPDGVEIIYLDDGSDPPLQPETSLSNFRIHQTGDKRPWTVELARNLGAKLANGEYLFMTDVDYIIPQQAIEAALEVTEDKMCIKRRLGVLDENGELLISLDVLRQYGVLESRIHAKGGYLPPHPNNFVMRKETFFRIGGYSEERVSIPYPNGGDGEFKRRWTKFYRRGEVTLRDSRPMIYMFPNGQFCGDVDSNPFDLFHTLTRKSPRNPYANLPD